MTSSRTRGATRHGGSRHTVGVETESARLLAVSDLHVGHPENREVLDRIRPTAAGDWLIVAGDVAEQVSQLEATLRRLRERFERVIWVPGNHELWTTPHDEVQLRGRARYDLLVRLCRDLGVDTPEDDYPVWPAGSGPHAEELLVVPLFTLYDYSWRPDGSTLAEAMAAATESRLVFSDEFLLHPDPYPTRQEWARHRVAESLRRLEARDGARRTVLVSHWPLHRQPTRLLRHQHLAMWCGSEATGDWHRRFRAAAVVYGHLHIPRSHEIDGVRFEEVSLGYPREWRRWNREPDPVRVIAVRCESGQPCRCPG
jgi:3',5'-cyclic AMP phosphodiesterase CpdA